MDKIKNFTDFNNFNEIDKTIRLYIKFVLNIDIKIDQYIPNTHIAEVFKNILSYSELEHIHQDIYYNVKHNPYDSIGLNNPDDYDKLEDGRYVQKETYSVGIIDVLIPDYFDLKRLKSDGVKEVYRVYQKLREKKDKVRNTCILGRIVLPYEYTDMNLTKSDKIKIK